MSDQVLEWRSLARLDLHFAFLPGVLEVHILEHICGVQDGVIPSSLLLDVGKHPRLWLRVLVNGVDGLLVVISLVADVHTDGGSPSDFLIPIQDTFIQFLHRVLLLGLVEGRLFLLWPQGVPVSMSIEGDTGLSFHC